MQHEHRFSIFCHDAERRNLAVVGAQTLANALVVALRFAEADASGELEVFVIDFETGRTVRMADALAAQAA